MKLIKLIALAIVAGVLQGCGAQQQQPQMSSVEDQPQVSSIEDSELGLDKNSVFETPEPIVATMAAGEPGDNQNLGAYFEGAPPPIPHLVEEFLPIRFDDNQCLDCHDDTSMIGQPIEAGDPTPIPATHYTDLRRNPQDVTETLVGARFVCVQCHAPQHDATPLVQNTYQQ
jgi:cytochrome c-type protein NapB